MFFSKLFTPQYWLWAVFLLPFLEMKKSVIYWGIITSAAIATLLMQYIYPLNYFDFLGYFNNGTNAYLFWVYELEMLFIILTGILTFTYFIHSFRYKIS